MSKNINVFIVGVIAVLSLLMPCRASAGNPYNYYPFSEETINGIRYWLCTRWVYDYEDYHPTMESFRVLGFSLNPDDKDTYIAPDGKIVPKMTGGLYVMAPNKPNGPHPIPDGALPSYVGDVYLPDMIENYGGNLETPNRYVFGFESTCIAEKVISIRTSLYMPIKSNHFKYAINLNKVQIGACYYIHPAAFRTCKDLETVIFEQAPYVYADAFAGCSRIKTVVLQSDSLLPLLETPSIFDDCVYKNATLYLPDLLMDECAKDPVWSKFVNRKSIKECTVELVKP